MFKFSITISQKKKVVLKIFEMDRYIDEVPRDIYTITDQIGSGSFSDIFSAIHIPTNTRVALKITFKNNNEEEMKSLEQEVQINKKLHHPFICQFFTEIETEHLIIIVMELIEGVSALNYVNQTSGLPLSEAKNLFAQLLIAMEYLHNEVHITHRDLKLENIMIDSFDHIRLIDFGFSSVNTMMSTCCGSIPYCAPEILLGQRYTKAADIWSMGVILYAFVDGNLPFYHSNMNTLAHMICQREVTFPNTFDEDLRDLLRKMLTKESEQRITIDEIKRHPFISGEKLLQIDYIQILKLPQYRDSNILLSPNRSSQIYNPYHYNQLLIGASSAGFPLSPDSGADSNLTNTKRFPLTKDSPKKATQSQNSVGNASKETVNELILSRNNFPSILNKVIQTAILNPQQNATILQQNPHFTTHLRDIRAPALRRNPHRSIFKNAAPLFHPQVRNTNIINNH